MSSRWKMWAIWLITGIASALIVNILLYRLLVSTGVIGTNLLLKDSALGKEYLTELNVVIATITPMMLGGILFLILLRYTSSPRWIYWTLLLLMLVLSFINPFMIPSIPIKAAIGLNILHLSPAIFSGISMTRFVK